MMKQSLHSALLSLIILIGDRARVLKSRNPESTLNLQISLFTYGEPRVGNRVFAHNVQAAITDGYRVVHRADMVPHLPPCK